MKYFILFDICNSQYFSCNGFIKYTKLTNDSIRIDRKTNDLSIQNPF